MLAFITLLFTLFYFMLITVLCNNKCLIPYFKDEETEKQRDGFTQGCKVSMWQILVLSPAFFPL